MRAVHKGDCMKRFAGMLFTVYCILLAAGCQTTGNVTQKNIALGKIASSSSNENDNENLPYNAIDGQLTTRWSSNRNNPGRTSVHKPHELTIDLLDEYSVHTIIVNIQGADNHNQTFTVFTSKDSKAWKPAGGEIVSTGIFKYKLKERARYIKYVSEYSSDDGQVNVYEIEVY